MGHRDTITGISFDSDNDQFYTTSNDRSLKVWNIREMMYMDSHYGHQSDILAMSQYSRDRVMSCGLDRQVIFWKVNEDTELLYKNTQHNTDTLNIINPHFFTTGSYADNCIDLWIMNKKKPIFTIADCHLNDSWILATDNVKSSDLLASSSYDGTINFYKFLKDKKEIIKTNTMTGFDGCLNCLKFSNVKGNQTKLKNEIMLAVTHSQEEKWGRWHVQPKAKNGISILRKIN